MFISSKAKNITPSSTMYIDAKYKSMLQQGIDVVGFGAGEPDFDTPPHIKQAAIDAINNGVTKYTPPSGTPALKQAICDKLKRDNGLDYTIQNIVVSNGAKHSLINIFQAICDPGDEVIIPSPYWVSYPEMVKLADGVPVYINTSEQNGFKFSAQDLENAVTPKTRALILNSPSNPTGMMYSKDELIQIAEVAKRHNFYVVSDEVYEKLIYGEIAHYSIAALDDEIKKLTIVVNGVSKTYAMTGWRIGYVACEAELAAAMGNIQGHATSNPNSIAQVAAIEALLSEQGQVEVMRQAFNQRRDYMVDRINSIENVSCIKPQGAFYVMMNITKALGKKYFGKEINTCDEFSKSLLENSKVALVAGEGFGAPGYLRWSYATSMENIKKGLDRLEEFLSSADK